MTKMPVILGPTACGKTAVAARLAFELGGEVISADSRQVYRGMDLGSGKDLSDYTVEGVPIPCHLINIAEPGSEYNIFEYQKDFTKAYSDITGRGRLPILCGGSGMYLEAVIKGYYLPDVPPDPGFAQRMHETDDQALVSELSRLKKLHGTTDTVDRNRMIRALEIEIKRCEPGRTGEPRSSIDSAGKPGQEAGKAVGTAFSPLPSIIFGINPGREVVRRRITFRLRDRLAAGMAEEVKGLLSRGIPPARLKAYGLEYKFITMYIQGELGYEEMFTRLNTAIHQFAKRQMTWFCRMERQGLKIHWIFAEAGTTETVAGIRRIMNL